MRHANFEIAIDDSDRLILRDLGGPYPSVTNDAEWVVEQVAARLQGRVLLYYDSCGDLDRLLVQDGKFAGFKHWVEP